MFGETWRFYYRHWWRLIWGSTGALITGLMLWFRVKKWGLGWPFEAVEVGSE